MKKENKTFKWTTKRGSKIDYNLGCEYRSAYDELLDDGWGGTISHKAKTVFTAKIFANGSLLFEIEYGSVLYDAETEKFSSAANQVLTAGERYYVAGDNNKNERCIVTMPTDIYNSITKSMNDFECSFEDIVEDKARKLEIKRTELVKFIKKAKKQNWLPTKVEYAKWRKKYNNVMNEGGEGYIPEYITKEALECAELRLEELNK